MIWGSWGCLYGWLDMCVCVCVCVSLYVCVFVTVFFLWARIGNYRHYFVHSTSSVYWSSSGTHNAWILTSTPRIPICSLVLQYSLNTSSMRNGTVLFGQRLSGLISPFLVCSSFSTMSPSNLPLRSHALCTCISQTSATKLTVTYCV